MIRITLYHTLPRSGNYIRTFEKILVNSFYSFITFEKFHVYNRHMKVVVFELFDLESDGQPKFGAYWRACAHARQNVNPR